MAGTKQKSLISYREVSNFLTGKPQNITRKRCAPKYRQAVQELELLLERWKSEHKPKH